MTLNEIIYDFGNDVEHLRGEEKIARRNETIQAVKDRVREVMVEKKDCHVSWAKDKRFKCDTCSMWARCYLCIKNKQISEMDKKVEVL